MKRRELSPHTKEKLDAVFGIDLRSLALFRVVLGVLLLVDIVIRLEDVSFFYSDQGVMPRGDLIPTLESTYQWSLNFLSGSVAFQYFLFLLLGIASMCLILGFQTKLTTILCWILLVSVQTRFPLILQGGDKLLRLLLLWSIFLPLGALYSVDSALKPKDEILPKRTRSAWTGALLLQVAFVYLFSGLLKDHPTWHTDFTAVYNTLHLDMFSTKLGNILREYPELLKLLTCFTYHLELYGWILAFSPFFTSPLRILAIILFVGFHLSLAATMALGVFPFIDIASWIVFIPTSAWDFISRRLERKKINVIIFHDGECSFCRKAVYLMRSFLLLTHAEIKESQSDDLAFKKMKEEKSWIVRIGEIEGTGYQAFLMLLKLSPLFFWLYPILASKLFQLLGARCYRYISQNRNEFAWILSPVRYRAEKFDVSIFSNAIALLFLFYAALWNVRTLNYNEHVKYLPASTDWIGFTLRLDQYWDMFAPYPMTSDGWFNFEGILADGSTVNLEQPGKAFVWDKPELLSSTHKNHRWRKYLVTLFLASHTKDRRYLADYYCRTWNQTHGASESLWEVKIWTMVEPTVPPGVTQTQEKVLIWHWLCHGKPLSEKSEKESTNL